MKIIFIGGGNMAAAIIAGLATDSGNSIRVVDHNLSKLQQLQQQFGIVPYTTLPTTLLQDEVVVLAVKPQQLKVVCQELAPLLAETKLVLSIAAGIRTEVLQHWMPNARVVRAMPNTPSMVKKGVTGLFAPAEINQQNRLAAEMIMRSVGKIVWLGDEVGIDDITCISGSGPAYVFYFMESMISAARDIGFDAAQARELVLATFEGAVALAQQQSALPIATLRENVTSKGGTTERAISRLDHENVKSAIIAAAMDCRARSIEMGQQLSQE